MPDDIVADMLRVIAEETNELLGNPVCAEPCEHGGVCTLPTGHDPGHEAWGSDEETMFCSW